MRSSSAPAHPAPAAFRAAIPPGFTLPELVIVLALIGIGAGFGVYSLRGYRASQQVRGAATELLSVVSAARARSAATNRPAVLDFAPAALAPGAGFVHVFLDLDGDAVADPGEAEAAALPGASRRAGLLGHQLPPGVHVRGPAGASTGPFGVPVQGDGVTFTGETVALLPDGTATEAGHLTLEDDEGRAWALTLTVGGGARLFRFDGSGWR